MYCYFKVPYELKTILKNLAVLQKNHFKILHDSIKIYDEACNFLKKVKVILPNLVRKTWKSQKILLFKIISYPG